jgi:Asp-tRNA(Asn)/Glu-tRNA(Gln) amidotransferase A subunit family amidase
MITSHPILLVEDDATLREALAETLRLADYDVVISPTFGAGTLALTNLSGHPEVVMPSGFRADGTPVSITLVAGHDREGVALALAKVWHKPNNTQRN